MENKKTILTQLLEQIRQRKPLIIVGIRELGDKVSLHSEHLGIGFNGRYYETVKHLGFGCFKGNTENGAFYFDAGGAMNTYYFSDKSFISYSKITVDNDSVTKDLKYPFKEVEHVLTNLLNSF